MQNYDVMMISTGDSFTMFPDMVKNQYRSILIQNKIFRLMEG